MGVVNVTPDSFSDGGEWFEPTAAIKHGRELLAAEGALISVDTMRAGVARLALDAGAVMINDVSGGQADPDMLPMVAERRTPYICMHWRGHSIDMQNKAEYDDVVAEVIAELGERVEAMRDAGVDLNRVALDPGFGFAKNADHNWEILRRLREFAVLGRPLLIGASRKTFLGRLLADEQTGEPRPAVRRDDASAAVSALAAAAGAWCVRAHAVAPSADAVRVAKRWGKV